MKSQFAYQKIRKDTQVFLMFDDIPKNFVTLRTQFSLITEGITIETPRTKIRLSISCINHSPKISIKYKLRS